MFESTGRFALFDYFRVPHERVDGESASPGLASLSVRGQTASLWPLDAALTSERRRPTSYFLGTTLSSGESHPTQRCVPGCHTSEGTGGPPRRFATSAASATAWTAGCCASSAPTGSRSESTGCATTGATSSRWRRCAAAARDPPARRALGRGRIPVARHPAAAGTDPRARLRLRLLVPGHRSVRAPAGGCCSWLPFFIRNTSSCRSRCRRITPCS